MFLRKEEATEEDPLKTYHSLMLSLPHLFPSCSTDLALGFAVLSNLCLTWSSEGKAMHFSVLRTAVN